MPGRTCDEGKKETRPRSGARATCAMQAWREGAASAAAPLPTPAPW